MNQEQSLKQLHTLRANRMNAIAAVKRKRAIRPSEAAMAISSYAQQIEAIDMAINTLSLATDLEWVRANYAGGSTAEVNKRLDYAISILRGTE